jgi:hypothetical protein
MKRESDRLVIAPKSELPIFPAPNTAIEPLVLLPILSPIFTTTSFSDLI